MISTTTAGYKNKISKFVLDSFETNATSPEEVILDVEEAIATKYAIKLQTAWRSRVARILVSALKQEANCKAHRNSHPQLLHNKTLMIHDCDTCAHGDAAAEIRQRICRQRYQEVEKLLFTGKSLITVNDLGDNWNQRFQRIREMPESNIEDKTRKYAALSALNRDFVSTATTYAATIISEYFLHRKDKSITAQDLGGAHGGKVV